jgi:hypothetical protein
MTKTKKGLKYCKIVFSIMHTNNAVFIKIKNFKEIFLQTLSTVGKDSHIFIVWMYTAVEHARLPHF